uniref:Carbohydrate sulfotransferase n=1 Tax=Steinernema glaseri TaxID=37863 RepID=A0A1I7YN23_9BILA
MLLEKPKRAIGYGPVVDMDPKCWTQVNSYAKVIHHRFLRESAVPLFSAQHYPWESPLAPLMNRPPLQSESRRLVPTSPSLLVFPFRRESSWNVSVRARETCRGSGSDVIRNYEEKKEFTRMLTLYADVAPVPHGHCGENESAYIGCIDVYVTLLYRKSQIRIFEDYALLHVLPHSCKAFPGVISCKGSKSSRSSPLSSSTLFHTKKDTPSLPYAILPYLEEFVTR